MNGATVSLLIALGLIVLGLLVLLIPLAANNWNFAALDPHKYETNTHTVTEDFAAISIDTSISDLTVLPSEDGTCRAVIYEQERLPHTVTVEDGTLKIRETDKRRWYDHIGGFDHPRITLYLPAASYGALTVDISTGDVLLSEGFTFASFALRGSTGDVTCRANILGDLNIDISTGDIALESITAGAVTLHGSTGDVVAKGVACASFASTRSTGHTRIEGLTAEGNVTLSCSTGRTELSAMSAADLSLRVTTGRSALTDVTARSLHSEGDTGRITLENAVFTDTLTIVRSTGDVTLTRCDAAELFIETSTGDVSGTLLSEKIFIPRASTGKIKVPETLTGGRCKVTTSTGDICFTIVE